MAGAGEFEFIRASLAPLSQGASGAANLTDDGATLSLSPGYELAITVDALVEGRHFPENEDPVLATRKALRANLSDLASMGAEPLGYLASVVWPEQGREGRANGFVEGLTLERDIYALPLMGGDTTATDGPWTLSITALGQIPIGQAIRRGGARPGDHVWVSGTIGDAWLGLQHRLGLTERNEAHIDFLARRFTLPEPRLSLGQSLRPIANACADVSDGLLADLNQISSASDVSIQINLEDVPVSQAVQDWEQGQADPERARLQIVTGGDDYELVFTVPEDRTEDMVKLGHATGLKVTRIGTVLEKSKSQDGLQVSHSGRPIKPNRLGFTHF